MCGSLGIYAQMTRTIVLGNAKGGTGKSTLAMHLAVALLNRGLSVATIDLDTQGTLSTSTARVSHFHKPTTQPSVPPATPRPITPP
jgi:cellulose biosynthesis protein BcsQ